MNEFFTSTPRLTTAALALSLWQVACSREPPPPSWLSIASGRGPAPEPAEAPKLQAVPTPFTSCDKARVNSLIRVDQFGYRPASKKVAILVDPVEGWNANDELSPGKTYEVHSWADGKLVFSGAPTIWNNGAVQKSSGDRGFWFDFSALMREGSYCIYDPAGGFRSYRFELGPSVYKNALRASLKMFYFQRANVAKSKPAACVGERCWIAAPDYVGPGQDRDAHSIKDKNNPKTARDLTGGWWDAGDVNKYVTFAQTPVHQLLTAYSDRPAPFTDDFGIPESGNGVPDILDEVKVELDWLKRMQAPDLNGGVLIKVGNIDFGDPIPEKSRFPRFYYPEPCSSSTIDAASMFAHGALVMHDVPQLKAYADDLKNRAQTAWTYFEQHPKKSDCDDGTIKSGDADRGPAEQQQAAVVAAIYLFALTGDDHYQDAIAKSFRSTRPMQEDRWSSYDPEQGDALLFYTTLANADPQVKAAVLERKLAQAHSVDLYGTEPARDLYRAYMRDDSFHWGHNQVVGNVGNTNYDLVQLKLVKGDELTIAADRAEALLQAFHGVNAMGLVYLTNMSAFGAESSANQIYHTWFRDGDPTYDDARTSTLGPAPGYVPGGPNPQYCAGQDPQKNKCATSRLRKQPAQKAYLDFNTGWNPDTEHDRSWELTEPGIYYQSAYVKLVSKFVD